MSWCSTYKTFLVAVVSVGATLFLLQQLSGINAVVYYSTAVFRSAGISSDVAASALVGASNVLGQYLSFQNFDIMLFAQTGYCFWMMFDFIAGTMVASSLMDKKGRKSLLIISFSGMVTFVLGQNQNV